MKRRLISIVLTVLCIITCIMPVVVSASGIMPRWENASTVSATITFNGTTGNVRVTIIGDPGTTNIATDVKLYYKNTNGNWIEIDKDWDYNVNQQYLSVKESFVGTKGREYKIELTGTVTKNGYAESVSASATAEC